MSSQTPRRLSLRRKRPPSDAEAKNSPSKRLSPSIDEDETQVLNLRNRVALKLSLKKAEDVKTNPKSPNSRIQPDINKLIPLSTPIVQQHEMSNESPLSSQRGGRRDSHRLRSLQRSTETRAHLLSPDSPFACSQLPSTQDCEVVWDCNSPGYSKEELKKRNSETSNLILSKTPSPITTTTAFHPNRILFNQSRPALRSRKEKNKNHGIVAELDDLLTKVQNEELNLLNDSFSDDDTMPKPLLAARFSDRSTQPFDTSNLDESELPQEESQGLNHKNQQIPFDLQRFDRLSAKQRSNNCINKTLSNLNSDLTRKDDNDSKAINFNGSKISKNVLNISKLEFDDDDDDDLFNDSLMKCTQELEEALYNKNTGKFYSPSTIHIDKNITGHPKLSNPVPKLEVLKSHKADTLDLFVSSKGSSNARQNYDHNTKLEKTISSELDKPKGKILPLASIPSDIVNTEKVQLANIDPEAKSGHIFSNILNNATTSCIGNPSKWNSIEKGKTNRASFQLGLPASSVISKSSKDCINYKASYYDNLNNSKKNICVSQLPTKNTSSIQAELGKQALSANNLFNNKVQIDKTFNKSIANINLDNRLLIHNKTLSLDSSSLVSGNRNVINKSSKGFPFGQGPVKSKSHFALSTVSKVTENPLTRSESFDYSMSVASQDISSLFERGISEEDNDDEFFNSIIPFVEEEERTYANLTQCVEDSKNDVDIVKDGIVASNKNFNKINCNPTQISKDNCYDNNSSTKDIQSVNKPTISGLTTKKFGRNSFKFEFSAAVDSNSQFQGKISNRPTTPKLSESTSTDIVKNNTFAIPPHIGLNKLKDILPSNNNHKLSNTAFAGLPSQPHFPSKDADVEDEDFFDDDMLEEISMMESQQPQSVKPKQSIAPTKNNVVLAKTLSESNITNVAGQRERRNDLTVTDDELSRFDEFFSLSSPVSSKCSQLNSKLKHNPHSIKDPTNLKSLVSKELGAKSMSDNNKLCKTFIPKNNFEQPIVNKTSNYKSSLRSFSTGSCSGDNSNNNSQHRCTQDEIARKRQEALKKRLQSAKR